MDKMGYLFGQKRRNSAPGHSVLSRHAGGGQRGTVLETRLVGLHVCSLPSQLLANAAIAASRVASYLRRSVSEGPKKEPRPKAGGSSQWKSSPQCIATWHATF